MASKWSTVAAIAIALGVLVGCATKPTTTVERDALTQNAASQWQEWNKIDPEVEAFAKKGYGYVFFPEITKGGLVVGAGYGRGLVYEHGDHVGYADVTQGSIGLQAGGQNYSELLVFEDQPAMDRFKNNRMEFGANASAIIARTGAAANAQFVDGVAVFVRPTVGAMAEASLGGQRTTYVPK
jgi:lipid-binding SYLF domain-containing protein